MCCQLPQFLPSTRRGQFRRDSPPRLVATSLVVVSPPRPRTFTAGNSALSSWRQVQPPGLNNNYRYQPPPPPQPRTTPSPVQPSPDPALDRIVAKLRAELALSESGGRQAAGGAAGGVGCLCERPTKLVLCQLCGATYPGRIALTCSSHPRKLFLQDLHRCRDCQAGNLDNLKEFELPPGMKESLGKIRKFWKLQVCVVLVLRESSVKRMSFYKSKLKSFSTLKSL